MAKGTGLRFGEILATPDIVQPMILSTANVAQGFAIPSGMGYAVFSANVDFWALFGATLVAIPTTASSGGTTNPELNPTARNIGSTAATPIIGIISATTGLGSISWYKP